MFRAVGTIFASDAGPGRPNGQLPTTEDFCSKAVAAFSPDLFLTGEMEGRLRAYTEFTVTNVHDLEAEFETIRQRGFAECVEEIECGMCSVAAPLAPSGPGALMSIGATGSVRVFTPEFREELGPRLTRIALEISASLGWNAAQDTRKTGLS